MLGKALTSLAIVVTWLVLRFALRRLEDRLHETDARRQIWMSKAADLALGAIAIIALGATWFRDAGHLAIFTGLVGGGAAFASQRVFQSIGGFLMIVFGRVFDLGERIEMGGVRGDVLDIGLMKTTIMEMGVPAKMRPDPNHWVGARQYTGRIVSVSNALALDQPVFNYSRNFDYLWDEMEFPIKYGTDLRTVEGLLLDVARDETAEIVEKARGRLRDMRHRVLLGDADLQPSVYIRLTDNWIEVSLRFLSETHGVRALKDRISRAVLHALQARGIELASGTYAIVEMPKLQLDVERPDAEPVEPPVVRHH